MNSFAAGSPGELIVGMQITPQGRTDGRDKIQRATHLTVEGLRDFLEANIELAALGQEMMWTQDELARCIEHAARQYNSFLPIDVDVVSPECLQITTNLFFNGAAADAYRRLLTKLQAQDIDIRGGGTDANLVKAMIAHAKEKWREHYQAFDEEGRATKRSKNIRLFAPGRFA